MEDTEKEKRGWQRMLNELMAVRARLNVSAWMARESQLDTGNPNGLAGKSYAALAYSLEDLAKYVDDMAGKYNRAFREMQ